MVLRVVVLLMVVWGALQAIAVFNTADASMGLMATINLIAVVALSNTVVKLTKDYFAQRAAADWARFRWPRLPRTRRRRRPRSGHATERSLPAGSGVCCRQGG